MTYGKYTAPSRTSTDVVYTKNSIYFNGVLIDGIVKVGLNWGYTGDEPSNLAKTILDHFYKTNYPLLDIRNEKNLSYWDFEKEVIAIQPTDQDLSIGTATILRWVFDKVNTSDIKLIDVDDLWEFMNNKDELCFQASLTSKIVKGEI